MDSRFFGCGVSMKFNCIVSDSIPNGTKFVALFYDGSGANVYMIDKAGHLINHEGEDIESSPDCYLTGSGIGLSCRKASKCGLNRGNRDDSNDTPKPGITGRG